MLDRTGSASLRFSTSLCGSLKNTNVKCCVRKARDLLHPTQPDHFQSGSHIKTEVRYCLVWLH